MTNQDLLTNELVKNNLSIFGFAEPYIINIIGITFDKYIYNSIVIEFDESNKAEFPIFSASTKTKESVLKVIGTRIIDGTDYEFCAVFQCDNLAIYGLKISSTEDLSIFLSKRADHWIKIPMSEKLLTSSGLELLNSAGIIWGPEPIGDLLNSCLLDLVDM